MGTLTHKTWDEFWGELILLRSHADNPERWNKRQRKAEWLFGILNLGSGTRILDLGCGDGILDICLTRRGASVTAIDRISCVLDAARREDETGKVHFINGDLRNISFSVASFDVVLMFELVGLMNTADDSMLIGKAYQWLDKNGHIVIDCPITPEKHLNNWKREFTDGVLEMQSRFDPDTRLQHIVPVFHHETGETIGLYDPYDTTKLDHEGVLRYLYPGSELVTILHENGFIIHEEPHLFSSEHYVLVGKKNA